MWNENSFRILAVVAAMSVGIVLFQQCTGNTQFSPSSQAESERSTETQQFEQATNEGGTGTGYDGKLYASRGLCPNEPKHIFSKIGFDRVKKIAFLLRESCEDLDSAASISVSDFEELEPNFESFRYRGEIFLPIERIGSAAREGVLPGIVEPNLPVTIVSEEFSMNSPTACGSGYCSCGGSVLYSCTAPQKLPEAFCKSKGYNSAVSWTCAPGPSARVCGLFTGNNCWQNEHSGNYICDRVTCR